MNRPEARVRLIVCGERLRSDDAAAILAAGMLPEDVLAMAEIAEVGQLGVEALLDVPEGTSVVVADAAAGIRAGEVVTLALNAVAGGGSSAAPASSHSMPPRQVLALAAELRGSMPRGMFVGLGGADFGFGEEPSAPVAAALPAFAEAIAEAIRSLAGKGA